MTREELVVFVERDTLGEVRIRPPEFAHRWIDHGSTRAEELATRGRDATLLVINKAVVGAAELALMPKLRLIAIAATGSDRVDLAACAARGVAVANVTGYAARTVAEHVLAVLLALRRSVAAYHQDVLAGTWSRSPIFCRLDYPIVDLAGSVLGLVGFGSIAKEVARLAEALGIVVRIAERRDATFVRPERAAFEQVLEEADALSLHCPLSAETRDLIGARELARMKPSAVLINTARGGLVDPIALAAALRSERLAGAALDVLPLEPPPADHPLIADPPPNLILTPHVAWASAGARQRVADEVVANLEAFVRGERRSRLV